MKNKFLSVVITLSMLFTVFAPMAPAKGLFPDVLSPDHDWAAEQIEIMTDLGIIKGYTDGTFKPDKSISKIEALLLFSRVAGFSNSEYEKAVEFAYDKYRPILDDIEIGAYEDYKEELAFLVYKGVLSDEELAKYLNDDAYLDEFPRSDAAILLTSLVGGEVKKTDASSLDFADADKIPQNALGYIAYAVKEGLMNGVEKDDGTIVFDAEAPLSRAQVCVLLYRIIEKLDISVEAGTVIKVNETSGIIDFDSSDGDEKSYIIPEEAKILVDGIEGKISDVLEKSDIIVVRRGKTVYSVEIFNPESNLTVKGTVDSVSTTKSYSKVSVKNEETGEIETFYSTEDVEVTTDGVADTFKSIKTNDFVVIKLLGSQIVSIDRLTAEATVQGILEDIKLSEPVELTVLTTDETTQKEKSSVYTVSEDTSARRDGERVSLSEILVGDKLVLTLKRGAVSRIEATSSKGTITGAVTGLNIKAQSEITISVNSKETTYPVKLDAEFIVAGEEASIYDIRLGNVVTLTLSGSTVTKLEQTASSTATTKAGVIEAVSTAYGYITLLTTGVSGSTSEQIFASKAGSSINVKILNGETGKEVLFKNLKAGDSIIATGAYSNGAFVAKTIVVTPAAE